MKEQHGSFKRICRNTSVSSTKGTVHDREYFQLILVATIYTAATATQDSRHGENIAAEVNKFIAPIQASTTICPGNPNQVLTAPAMHARLKIAKIAKSENAFRFTRSPYLAAKNCHACELKALFAKSYGTKLWMFSDLVRFCTGVKLSPWDPWKQMNAKLQPAILLLQRTEPK